MFKTLVADAFSKTLRACVENAAGKQLKNKQYEDMGGDAISVLNPDGTFDARVVLEL